METSLLLFGSVIASFWIVYRYEKGEDIMSMIIVLSLLYLCTIISAIKENSKRNG